MQTRIAKKQSDKHGNCLAACYCSVIDRPYLLESLSDAMEPADTSDEQRVLANRFLQPLGWTVVTLINFDIPGEPMACESVAPIVRVACGRGPRGFHHAIVQLPDDSYHDPHPDGAGLPGHINRFDVILPVDNGSAGHMSEGDK